MLNVGANVVVVGRNEALAEAGAPAGFLGTVLDVVDPRFALVDLGIGEPMLIERDHLDPIDLAALPTAGDVVRTADGRIAVVVVVAEQDLHLDLEGDGMCIALRSDPSLVIDRSDATRRRARRLGLRFPPDHGDEG